MNWLSQHVVILMRVGAVRFFAQAFNYFVIRFASAADPVMEKPWSELCRRSGISPMLT